MSDSLVAQRAQVLAEALPYIQKYYGKTVVVKYGGNAMISDELRRAVISDLILLHLVGIRVVVVHGGGPEITEMLRKIGKESRFVDGLRYTDEETMDVVQQMLDEKYGLVGEITAVEPRVVVDSLENGYIPVVSTVAQGTDGPAAYNINADTAAAKLAVALGAEKLLLLTDVRGLLRDPADEGTLLPEVRLSQVPGLVKDGVIKGGMLPKVECCVEAVRSGVKNAVILDGRIPHSLLIELLSDAGIGTMLL